MEQTDDLGALLSETGPNAIVGWIVVLILLLTAILTALEGAYDWTFIALVVVALGVVPGVAFRDPRVMPPWELVAVAAVPVLWQALLGRAFVTDVPAYLAVAALALLVNSASKPRPKPRFFADMGNLYSRYDACAGCCSARRITSPANAR